MLFSEVSVRDLKMFHFSLWLVILVNYKDPTETMKINKKVLNKSQE